MTALLKQDAAYGAITKAKTLDVSPIGGGAITSEASINKTPTPRFGGRGVACRNRLSHRADHPTSAVRAWLTGDDTCSALGITVQSTSPVLALCRKLVDAGHDPATPLDVYRADVRALKI